MKLFTRYSRINILATVIIFVLASLAFAILLRYVLIDQIDDYLKTEQKEIEAYYEKYKHLPETMELKDQQISYELSATLLKKKHFVTLKMHEPGNDEQNLMRQVAFGINVNGQPYKVTVSKSLEGTEDLIRSILIITTTTILVILIVSFLINRLVLRELWKPFYNSMEIMRHFKLGQKQRPEFVKSNIDEFSFMNQVLSETTGKAEQDYKMLKEFTENASHELQTPLAIIRSKLDLLIQDEAITEQQSKTVVSAYDAIQKMSRLNQSLLLLSKIDNRQFSETKSINLEEKLLEKREQFKELWDNQHLNILYDIQPVQIRMNEELADILLNNLLSNASRHNFPGGQIAVELRPTYLKITNSGVNKSILNNNLFNRFYKPEPLKESNGLGLSIIKQIAELSGYSIAYDYANGHHSFSMQFNQK